MADAPAPEAPNRLGSLPHKKSVTIGITVDLILAALVFLLSLLAQANSPTGKVLGLR